MRVLELITNMFRQKAGRIFLTTAIVICASSIDAQSQAFKNISGSQIKVNGTSNIHDWTMVSSSFTADGSLLMKSDQLQDLQSLNFSLPVTTLKSKEDLMNTRAYKALKSDQFSKVTFKLTNATVVSQQKIIKANGNLTIAGVTKPITLQATYTNSGDEITFKSTKAIKMSEFGIKPPSFMMGALKVGDSVTIDLTLKVKN